MYIDSVYVLDFAATAGDEMVGAEGAAVTVAAGTEARFATV